MSKLRNTVTLILTVLSLFATSVLSEDRRPKDVRKAGEHGGENNQITVDIQFSGQYGETITDENGTSYHVWGWSSTEDKIYPPEYWGVFPLYFFGTEVGCTITVSNMAPRQVAKIRVRTEVYSLRTDGTQAGQLCPRQDVDVEIPASDSATVDASFVAQYAADVESGLDRVVVKILHQTSADDDLEDTDDDPSLILMKEGVICPPKVDEEFVESLLEEIE